MGIVKAKWLVVAALAGWVAGMLSLATLATEAELYFATDKNGEDRVTTIQEGEDVWIVVYDPDEDIDCDVRDKVWTDIKVMDIKTGAHIVWKSYIDSHGVDTSGDGQGDDVFFGDATYQPHKGHYPGASAGWLGADYLEETNRGTGLFVSSRPFKIGTRAAFSSDGRDYAHITGPYAGAVAGVDPTDFQWGGYLYADTIADADELGDERIWVDARQGFVLATDPGSEVPPGNAYLPPGDAGAAADDYMLGRFENMDTLVGLYVDPNDPGDVALDLLKIADHEASIEWSREVYRDANESATIIVTDPDENLNCDAVEMIPVFVMVNPGSWNPLNIARTSANDFCMLKRFGGVVDILGTVPDPPRPLEWYNLYDSGTFIDLTLDGSNQPNVPGTYYIQYPTAAHDDVTSFDTASDSGVTRVMFYAQETGADTGVFELRLNSILRDLGFDTLDVRDVLVAYYVDPNDQDDFKLATAYIEERATSTLRFTNYGREDTREFWIGRDPVYVEVVDQNANTDDCCPEAVLVNICDPHEVDDSEWLILDETSSNSPVFFSHSGMHLVSVWDASGIGDPDGEGGYSLRLDNWELEAFNEDSIYGRYNDVVYNDAEVALLADIDTGTAFPPLIDSVRVDNDVSFAVFEVADTQVFDGEKVTMYFLDRQGNRVDGYVNSDCVFIQLIDPDQDEDRLRRERIDATWDGAQNVPHGPIDDPDNHLACGYRDRDVHLVNELLGDTDIFQSASWPKVYVLNPRNGRWAAVDLLETAIDSGEFVSVTCIDLVSTYECLPSLGVLPGDTLIAAYQDPSNHSDVAWISIRVDVGGALVPGSSVSFVDEDGEEVAAYIVGEPIYVKVNDVSIADAGVLVDAVTVAGQTYDLSPMPGGAPGEFITPRIELDPAIGDTVTADYVDPSNPRDTSTATIQIVALDLVVERFFAGPSPFNETATFGYIGAGLAETFHVSVYDLAGRLVWEAQGENVLGISWTGETAGGDLAANGAYVYVVVATGSGKTYTGRDTVFIKR